MRNITVVTGGRAEYGVLKNIMKQIESDSKLNLQIVVTGSHLSSKYGMTKEEIIKDGFNISKEIPIIFDENEKNRNASEFVRASNGFLQAFDELNTDILLILGDRYEIFAASCVALMMNIPIAHISGGEVTEGALDEQIRHSITKMAHIHFPGADIYCDNIIKMGEEKWRVFNVGDPGIENIKTTKILERHELNEILKINNDFILVTYHPVTLELEQLQKQISNLIAALDKIDMNIVFTYPNADNGSDIIIDAINEFATKKENVRVFKNLGNSKYLSAMKHSRAIVGNSSSAIIEAPFLKKPVVNVGNRQNGRLMADNIICSSVEKDDIFNSITEALSESHRNKSKYCKSLYGDGNTSEKIVDILRELEINEKLLKKKLYSNENI